MTTPAANTVAQADHEAAVAQAAATARTEAKARIVAIKGLDEAKARPAAAEACAMDSDMTVDQAKAFLAKLPEEPKAEAPAPAAAAPATNSGNPAFDKLMAEAGKGPGAAASETQETLTADQKDAAAAARVLAARFGETPSTAKH